MSHFDVIIHTVYLVRSGSHAYGTSLPDSDVDVRGVCVEPVRLRLGFLHAFEQSEAPIPGLSDDVTIYSLRKFCKLAADCNPNVVELLHVDESDMLRCDAVGRAMRYMAPTFLSRRAYKTFTGYAHAQLKKLEHPERAERTGRRAEAIAEHGFDTKHAMHLIRLLRMAREILSDGVVKVRRPDAAELLAIRRGEVLRSDILAEAARLRAECDALLPKSPLPEKPNEQAIDDWMVNVYLSQVAAH